MTILLGVSASSPDRDLCITIVPTPKHVPETPRKLQGILYKHAQAGVNPMTRHFHLPFKLRAISRSGHPLDVLPLFSISVRQLSLIERRRTLV